MRYHGDGSGRDGYVIANSGGLFKAQIKAPRDFANNLRYIKFLFISSILTDDFFQVV